MRILITGGCGFIGSNFIRYILNKYPDYRLINLDALTYAGNIKNLKDIEDNKNYQFVQGDICDEKIVNDLVTKVDYVINFAAESHVDRSINDIDGFVRTNFLGVKILLDAIRNHRIKLFLQISTDETYGSIKSGSFTEESTLRPSSPYSASKAAADLLAISYYTTYDVPIMITRSTNNFGPYQYPEKFIPLFITNLLENKKVPLYGKGNNVRNWIYVEDNCAAIDMVFHNGKVGEVYNIGSSDEVENIKVTSLLLDKLGKGDDMIEPVADRLGHDFRYSLDSAKVKKLGWAPEHNFEENLKATIEWYQNNPEWWKELKKINT